MSWLTEPVAGTTDLTTRTVTRVEFIDHRSSSGKPGRVFQAYDVDTTLLSFQDDGRTLKVFIA